jgi:hypothetical protein
LEDGVALLPLPQDAGSSMDRLPRELIWRDPYGSRQTRSTALGDNYTHAFGRLR